MELDSLREQTRRDAEGIQKTLQVSIHAAKLENWEPVKPRLNEFNSTYRNIVGPVFASPGQTIATF